MICYITCALHERCRCTFDHFTNGNTKSMKDKLYTHHTNTRPLNFLAWYGHKYKVAPLFKEQLLLKDTWFGFSSMLFIQVLLIELTSMTERCSSLTFVHMATTTHMGSHNDTVYPASSLCIYVSTCDKMENQKDHNIWTVSKSKTTFLAW
jgi:hypothetical protein